MDIVLKNVNHGENLRIGTKFIYFQKYKDCFFHTKKIFL
jgi:hypothetical protein